MTAALVVVLVTVAVVTCVRRTMMRVVIEGPSMLPTLDDGSRVLVRRIGPAVRVGAVVVLETPAIGAPTAATGRWVVKRVAAVPGDPLPPAVAAATGAPAGSRVPPGHVAVLGDNPDESIDSRHYGPVALTRVLGVAVGHRPRPVR